MRECADVRQLLALQHVLAHTVCRGSEKENLKRAETFQMNCKNSLEKQTADCISVSLIEVLVVYEVVPKYHVSSNILVGNIQLVTNHKRIWKMSSSIFNHLNWFQDNF